MTRKRFSESEVIHTLMHQGTLIWCYRCKVRFELNDKIEREHLVEVALGGADIPFNCAYSHASCHAKITNGSKATTAGSSKQRIAKVRRIQNPKPSKHPMRNSGRKIASRPFAKRKEK